MKGRLLCRVYSYSDIVCWCLYFKKGYFTLNLPFQYQTPSLVALKVAARSCCFLLTAAVVFLNSVSYNN